MSTEKPFPWSLAEFVPIERDIPDPVGAVLAFLGRDTSIDPDDDDECVSFVFSKTHRYFPQYWCQRCGVHFSVHAQANRDEVTSP